MTTARRVPAKWGPSKKQILEAYRDGLEVKEIREKFGISYYALYQLLNIEGIPLRSAVVRRPKTGRGLPSPGRTR